MSSVNSAWLVPPTVLVIGAFAAALIGRAITSALNDADAARRRFRKLEDGLIPLRVETRRVRGSVDRFESR
ncbi:MAG: hypothetical protein KDA95_09635 [Acidimicrobiales bacterium]|nr:hypothetical protein [Acidimicrobiales bacterium]